ncbi:MAG TPA: prolyl oligopeptidase family serine peptidase [Flexivirga sp.]|uniref:alpha/beta hydrolase family esterase n=1 Tax=Flexivirga sp. TaxID=1962927 RepID=UPI002B7828D1|nr:prolyl oligopeptidase family serine peptidase [Flexivirga sp.]HWC20961.1 prolyl oligopeptidase family serine peptidase [Flexivirga sp.]
MKTIRQRLAVLTVSLMTTGALGAMAAPAVAAGGSPDASPETGGAQAAAQSCTKATDQESGASAKYEITSGDDTRTYILHLPKNYEQHRNWPLIVAYHGRGSTGTEIEGFSGLSSLPAVVAYPNGEIGTGSGYRQAWQGAPYAPPGVDDVKFTSDLLDQLQSDYCVDPSRTYATGKSNGAGFVNLLACRMADRFAAFAPTSGAFYPQATEGCDSAKPVALLDIHGTGDSTIPYAGDPDRKLPAIRSYVADWAARDKCDPNPSTRRIGTDVTVYDWTNCAAGDVEHVAVTGGGHVWPGTNTYSGGGHVTHTIAAQDVMWRFFSEHRLAAPRGAMS